MSKTDNDFWKIECEWILQYMAQIIGNFSKIKIYLIYESLRFIDFVSKFLQLSLNPTLYKPLSSNPKEFLIIILKHFEVTKKTSNLKFSINQISQQEFEGCIY